MIVRRPSVAGQFYSGTESALKKELSLLIDNKARKVDCLGVISPHAGYIYSGGVAGKVLSRIKFKDSFVILGPNHTGMGEHFAILSKGSWQTPIGDVGIDEELAEYIIKESTYIKEDPGAHIHEHSIEVQLPFLQYIKNAIKFVPIVVAQADLKTYRAIGKELAGAINKSGKKVVMIASTDMTHYEAHESAKEKDKRAIDAILALDEGRLAKEISKWEISMCGSGPAIIMLSALKELGAKKAELIDYKTSGDISGDYSSVVGYAGIIIK